MNYHPDAMIEFLTLSGQNFPRFGNLAAVVSMHGIDERGVRLQVVDYDRVSIV